MSFLSSVVAIIRNTEEEGVGRRMVPGGEYRAIFSIGLKRFIGWLAKLKPLPYS